MLWILLLSASSRCALKRKCFCLVTWTHRSRGKQSTRDFRRTTLNYIGDFQTSFVYPCLSYRLLTEFNPPKRPCKRVARSTRPFPFPTPSQTTAAVVTQRHDFHLLSPLPERSATFFLGATCPSWSAWNLRMRS